MADTKYVVTAPGINVRNAEGGQTLIYNGAVVPGGQDPTWIEQMLAEGLIAKADDAEAIAEATAVRGAVADVPDNSPDSDEKTARRSTGK